MDCNTLQRIMCIVLFLYIYIFTYTHYIYIHMQVKWSKTLFLIVPWGHTENGKLLGFSPLGSHDLEMVGKRTHIGPCE